MINVIVRPCSLKLGGRSSICISSNGAVNIASLKNEVSDRLAIPVEQFQLCHGKGYLLEDDVIQEDQTIYLVFGLDGGKGGFGSMLRAIGAQIEKTTNKEACRDLSGRRLRDINEEKRLKKWIAKQAEREREQAERKRQRLERLRTQPAHDFNDPSYDKIRSTLADNVSDAVTQGLEKMKNKAPPKRKVAVEETGPSKKLHLWMDEEFEDSDEGESSDSKSSTASTSEISSASHSSSCARDENSQPDSKQNETPDDESRPSIDGHLESNSGPTEIILNPEQCDEKVNCDVPETSIQ